MIFYIYLLLSSGCSILLVHLVKVAEDRELRMLNIFTVNYLVAAIFSFSIEGIPDVGIDTESSAVLLVFCLVVGAIFITNFLIYSKSIHLNGMGVSVAAMRLSLLIPVFLSVLYYSEPFSTLKGTALVLVFVAFTLLYPFRKRIRFKNINAAWLLLIVFILTGFADFSLKIYEEDFSLDLSGMEFMVVIFTVAFLIGFISCIIQKGKLINRRELLLGTLIGIPNLYSSLFLIYGLEGIDGSVAYPIVNVLNVVGATLLGLWYWGDRITKKQWAGIAAALTAISLLLL